MAVESACHSSVTPAHLPERFRMKRGVEDWANGEGELVELARTGAGNLSLGSGEGDIQE